MKISELDIEKRTDLKPGDIVSEKVDGGYQVKFYCAPDIYEYFDDAVFDGDDELVMKCGVFFVERAKNNVP